MKTVIKFLTTLLVASLLACNTREELGTDMICLNEIFVRHSNNYEMMADFNYEKTALFGDSTTKLNLRGDLV